MRLFHVSEESDIEVFEPRLPSRRDLDQSVGLVWAIDEDHLPSFLTPRDCPRVTYHISSNSSIEDRIRFFSSSTTIHAVVFESDWYYKIMNTVLYIYEFEPSDFTLLDPVAGYYVSQKTQRPVSKHIVNDLIGELLKRNIELRITDNLWDIADAVKQSSLNWSICRMKNALPRK